jgi:hypothetical protein
MKKFIKNIRIKNLIRKGDEYFTITENGVVTAIHFCRV